MADQGRKYWRNKEKREKREFCVNHGNYFMEVVSSAEPRGLIKVFKMEKVFQDCRKGKGNKCWNKNMSFCIYYTSWVVRVKIKIAVSSIKFQPNQ